MRDERIPYAVTNPVKFRIMNIPGDGHCFFTAIGCQIGVDSGTLREVAVKLFKHSDADEKQLMATADGLTERAYILRLANGMFGGHNEMVMLAKHYNLVIYVYSRTPAGFRKLTTVRPPPTAQHPRQVFILWDGAAHYDALVPT
ncbi:MAG: hypothetical protein CBC65_001155 [Rhodothermaceae bacterium TMED105]|nr:MAG: hypothetical protein CBC65_001155 [Rhodothermaceae bacterium TMED105]